MIKRIGEKPFYQWELDRQISVENVEFDEIHFENKLIEKALVTEPSSNIVNIPNILLQSAENIYVFVMKDEKVVERTSFGVCPKKQPEDYVYTETEHFTYANLEARVKKLEKNQNTGGIADGEIVTSKIADGAVTEEKLSGELKNKINSKPDYLIVTDDMAVDGVITVSLTMETKEVVVKTNTPVNILLPEDLYLYWRVIINTTEVESVAIDIGDSNGSMFGTDSAFYLYEGKTYMIVKTSSNFVSPTALNAYEVDPITRLPIDNELNALASELHAVVTGGDVDE